MCLPNYIHRHNRHRVRMIKYNIKSCRFCQSVEEETHEREVCVGCICDFERRGLKMPERSDIVNFGSDWRR